MKVQENRTVEVTYCDMCGKELKSNYTSIIEDLIRVDLCDEWSSTDNCLERFKKQRQWQK